MNIGELGQGGAADPALQERRIAQMAAAATRHRGAQGQIDDIARRREQGMRYPDEPERLARRARRLVQAGEVPGEILLAIPPGGDAVETDERIIGDSNDLQAAAFLPRGVRASATVGRIWLRLGGRVQPAATGFLVAPRLLLTNHHVFPEAAGTLDAFVEFGAEAGLDDMPAPTVRFGFAPDVFFLADEHLDYALVALAPGADGRSAGELFGWNRLDPAEGKLVIGDPVNIIGHPSGRLKEIAVRENELLVRLDDFLHYKTDTEPGNSGSPVFNDQWEVVALHHRGVPKTDDQGRTLNVDGGVWTAAQGDAAVAWIANEGARISAVVRHLAANTPDELRPVLGELGPAVGAPPSSPPGTSGAAAATGAAGSTASSTAGAAAGAAGSATGAPIGGPSDAPAPLDPIAAGPAPLDQPVHDQPVLGPAVLVPPPAGPVPPTVGPAAPVPTPRAPETVGATTSTTYRTGVAGRTEAFGAARQLVFLHGRSQQGRDPEEMRREWAAGLNNGLTRLGFATVDPRDVFFPYYGDLLADALNTRESVATSFDAVADDPAAAAAPASASARDLYHGMLDQAAERSGMPAGAREDGDNGVAVGGDERFGVGGVVHLTRRPLDWIARHSGVDRLVVAKAFRDVALYLDTAAVRERVLACVRDTVPRTGGIVLVAHSLGTVVAMDLLCDPEGPDVTGLLTLGAPLGLDTVHDRLRTRGPHCPTRVPWWFNGWAPADGVAIGCPLRGRWSGVSTEACVDNPRDRAHDIDEYLTRPEVAAALATALGLARR
ncbi:trypsin-like serine peptidase [Streptodolium elevatio]|uniref:Serine protease n=1 Tax=Streptodolium elevatio TaxID=3157996 RepID=A0ABV3DUD2_9ACTN